METLNVSHVTNFSAIEAQEATSLADELLGYTAPTWLEENGTQWGDATAESRQNHTSDMTGISASHRNLDIASSTSSSAITSTMDAIRDVTTYILTTIMTSSITGVTSAVTSSPSHLTTPTSSSGFTHQPQHISSSIASGSVTPSSSSSASSSSSHSIVSSILTQHTSSFISSMSSTLQPSPGLATSSVTTNHHTHDNSSSSNLLSDSHLYNGSTNLSNDTWAMSRSTSFLQVVDYQTLVTCTILAGVMLTLLVLVGWAQCRRTWQYQRIATSDDKTYDYIYKPLQGGILDEEYENTFVGVSIPLLQDVSKV